MTRDLRQPAFLPRDGTSQQGRALPALAPESVRVDERTIQDLVAFARELGGGLAYHDRDGQRAGTWSGFLRARDPSVDATFPALVAAFLDDPDRFDPARFPELYRPHVVLFLAFLRLFQHAQDHLNELTQRHLDFYYRRVLQMAGKGPVPDQVHLLFELARGEREIELRGETLVSAGPDRLGREQLYATEQPIIVNRIAIAKKRTVFVKRRRTGFAEARDARAAARGPRGETATPVELLLAMLPIALGEPLAVYPGAAQPVDAKLLDELARQATEDHGFYLTVFEIADLIRLAGLPDECPDKPPQIAALLARSRQRQVSQHVSPVVEPALLDVVSYWDGLERYFRMPPESFHEIMRSLDAADATAWKRIEALLEGAYQRKVREDRMKRFADLHGATPADTPGADVLAPLLREALGDNATEFSLASLLDADQRDALAKARLGSDWHAWDWETLYGLLDQAQRNRYGERPAQKVEWIDLVAADVAAAETGGQVGAGRWATFGRPRPASSPVPPEPALGWAICAPLLWLREGNRTITLTLGLHLPPGMEQKAYEAHLRAVLQVSALPLVLQVSTVKGWIECPQVDVKVGDFAELSRVSGGDARVGVQLKVTLAASVDPIAPPAKAGETASPWPGLRLMLRQLRPDPGEAGVAAYDALAALSVLIAHLAVEVSDLRPQRLQNDERILDPAKPFEPFGSAPAIGSRLLIGHPEISGKRLDQLDLKLEWMGAPEDLTTHYGSYAKLDPSKLAVRLAMIGRGKEIDLALPQPLFAPISFTPAPGSTEEDLESISAGALPREVADWPRSLQVELHGSDFGHAIYPAVAAGKAIALAAELAKDPATVIAADYKVNPPYTPKLKSLRLGYKSSLSLRVAAGAPDPRAARVLYVHPFGECELHRELGPQPLPTGAPLLPRYDHDGELYLGLSDVAPPQRVSLLFQLAEGSADPDLPPQPVTWSYLDGDRWTPFAHRLLRDTTNGLTGSGIIELALDAVAPSTRVDGGLYWIRAAVEHGTASVCDTIDIHPQAVSARGVDRDNAPERFRDPLPETSIKKLVTRVPGIAGVRQPYRSRGGKTAEDPATWATRVSERLRHKQRALSMWDYERLALEQFPQIYKVRCLPAPADAPGRVELVVIPDVRGRLSDPFEPKAPRSLLRELAAYLQERTPAFAEVAVRNAAYVPVRVHLAVRFTGDGNDAFYIRKLQDELDRFLSPWAFAEGSDIVLGGKIHRNGIVDFVDRRDYVDYVAAVRFTLPLGRGVLSPEGDFVVAGHDAIIVTARDHEISVLEDAVYVDTPTTGIDFMRVELDFIVA